MKPVQMVLVATSACAAAVPLNSPKGKIPGQDPGLPILTLVKLLLFAMPTMKLSIPTRNFTWKSTKDVGGPRVEVLRELSS